MTYSMKVSVFYCIGMFVCVLKGGARLWARATRFSICCWLAMSIGRCGLVSAYASWQVSSSQLARGLPTRQVCSIRHVKVPDSKRTSLIGSRGGARRMCPNR